MQSIEVKYRKNKSLKLDLGHGKDFNVLFPSSSETGETKKLFFI
jgi:hypothetical protein